MLCGKTQKDQGGPTWYVIEQENFPNPEQVALGTFVELPADQAAFNALKGLSLINLYISANLTAVCMLLGSICPTCATAMTRIEVFFHITNIQ